VVLRSDIRRKHLAGAPRGGRKPVEFGAGIYDAETTERTYRSLLLDAGVELASGRSVVLDASFSRAAQRKPFLDLAERTGVPYALVEAVAPESVIRARMEARARDPNEASDADFSIYLRMREVYEPPREIRVPHLLQAGPDELAEELTARTIDRLLAQVR
jgi:predicted kinase